MRMLESNGADNQKQQITGKLHTLLAAVAVSSNRKGESSTRQHERNTLWEDTEGVLVNNLHHGNSLGKLV